MSRVASQPVAVPSGVEVKLNGQHLAVKGSKGEMSLDIHDDVCVEHNDNEINIQIEKSKNIAMAGTMRALINNLVVGVSDGFEKKLELVGVGYRAQAIIR